MVRRRAGRRQAAARLALAACLALAVPVHPAEGQTQLRLVKTVTVTTTAEGGGARPEIVATADRVFVLYLGSIGSGSERTFNVRVYDRDLETVLASRTLVATTPEHGGPTDIRVASDGRSLYAFYETHKPTSPTTATTYLWGARYSLDEAFTLVAATPAPIATSHPLAELPEGGELLDDPAPLAEVAALGPAPADGDHALHSGALPPGTYTLCLGYDRVPDGRLDPTGAVHDCAAVTVRGP